jgi:hypothetical protein
LALSARSSAVPVIEVSLELMVVVMVSSMRLVD